MKIVVLSVGRVRQRFVLDAEGEYLQRIKGSFQVELVELGMESPESMKPAEVQAREAEEVLKKMKNYDYLVVLDERGKEMSSKALSEFVQTRMNSGVKSVCFVIGGAYGFAEKVRQEADLILSLSALTFPHQLTRMLLVEQLYRSHTLIKGISYHK
jgi:23S rRNA (pseudouridine1915-N3)-methyltransferase